MSGLAMSLPGKGYSPPAPSLAMNEFFNDEVMPYLLKNEGFYSNVAADRGGETYAGITRVYNPEWPGWDVIDGKSETTWAELKDHVYNFYWNRYRHWRLDEVEQHAPLLAQYMFDTAVLFGGRRMVRYVQDALNLIAQSRSRSRMAYARLEVDGHIGPKTIAAIYSLRPNRNEIAALIALLVHRRIEHHSTRITESPDQQIFYIGWLARAIRLG